MAASRDFNRKAACSDPPTLRTLPARGRLPLMEYVTEETREDRLYLKALGIRYERRTGKWLPIIWHLALRQHKGAMRELADWLSDDGVTGEFGSPSDAYSPSGLYRRSFKRGDTVAAANAAVSCFNRNDMIGYRRWLQAGAKSGDPDSRKQLHQFETRLPHKSAAKIRRLRPEQKRDAFA